MVSSRVVRAVLRGPASVLYGDGAIGAAAIGALPRRLALMRLVLALGHGPERGATEAEIESVRFVHSPGQASYLAADLARLMDLVESEEVSLENLDGLVTGDLAVHWEATVEFLKIVTEHSPDYLADNRLVSPVARRNRLMALETERLAKGSPHPVIAAGSTGTVPATARLLKTIASLPNGAVVLPGLDLTLDDESWAMLAEHPGLRAQIADTHYATLHRAAEQGDAAALALLLDCGFDPNRDVLRVVPHDRHERGNRAALLDDAQPARGKCARDEARAFEQR